MSKRNHYSVITLALLATLGASVPATVHFTTGSGTAQTPATSPAFPLPTAVPSGSTVRVDGSPSMGVVNQFLKQRYEKAYPGTQVNLNASSADAALQDLVAGKVDLAAIGRPLTPAEKAQGLVPVTVGREKIAIIVGPGNPYQGNITFAQFAKIFRGEITDWSQLGGAPGPIRFIDRPASSDTRQAFRPYPVFQTAPFQNGATTVKVGQDDTAEVIQQLGTDGISYAVYSQVKNVENVRVLPMHQTLPSDSRYPFSQPRYYVYNKTPAAGTTAFLGFVSAAPGQAAIADANAFEAAAIATAAATASSPAAAPEATLAPATVSPSPATAAQGGDPGAVATASSAGDWWSRWLLLLPIALIGWAWWSSRRKGSSPAEPGATHPGAMTDTSAASPPAAPAITGAESPGVVEPGAAGPPVPPSVESVPSAAIVPEPPIASPEPPSVPPPMPSAEVSPPAPSSPPSISASEPPAITPTLAAASAALAAGAGAVVWSNLADDRSQSTVEASKFDVGQEDRTGIPEGRGDSTLADVDEGLDDLPTGYGESRIVLMPRDPQWAYAYWDVPNEHKLALRREGGNRLALRFYDVTDINPEHQNPHSLQQYDCEEIAQDWYIPVPLSDRDYLVEIGYLTNDGRWLMLARSAPVRIPPVYPTDISNDQFMSVDWSEPLQGKTFMDFDLPGQSPSMHEKMFELAQPSHHLAGSVYGSMQAVSSHVFPSGIGMISGAGMSGAGMSGAGMSGVGMSGIGMSGIGMGFPTLSGIGMMSGIGMSNVGMSGIGMSGVGMGVPTMSGIGMSGIGMSVPTMSGIGMSGIGMSGIGMSGIGMSGVGLYPARSRKFWLVADAELIVYGATEPDATVTIAGQPVPLNPDGTFRFHMSFPNGLIDFPIFAVAADGVQSRSVHLTFNRDTPTQNTNTKDEATDEPI